MSSEDERRRRIADQFAKLAGQDPGNPFADLFSGLGRRPAPTPPQATRPARVTVQVDDAKRFHVVPVAKAEVYYKLGWVVRAVVKSDGKPIACFLEWPGAAVNPDDVGPHPVTP